MKDNIIIILVIIFLAVKISGCRNSNSNDVVNNMAENIDNKSGLNTVKIKYYPETWYELRKLVCDESIKLWEIDTSKITDMHNLFYQSERKDFAGIEDWNVSNVKDMSGMFKYTPINHNLNKWNVSKVENMHKMFFSAVFFNQDISNWNVSNVKDMSHMFEYAVRFNQDIGGWDTKNVINMSWIFVGAKSFNQDIGNWNTENVKDMNRMFLKAENFNQDISRWNVSNVEDMSYMFCDAVNFNQNLNSWDTFKVKDMENMFIKTPLENNLPVWYTVLYQIN